MVRSETYILSNGVKIPKIGFGTWFIGNKEAPKAVQEAINVGYRLIDTAQAYENEKGVGEGIRKSGMARDKIFVVDKIAAETKSFKSAIKAIDDMLAKTGLEYLDLAIIHAPQPWAQWRDNNNRYFQENIEVWRAMEKAYKDGKFRAIGVSNFLIDDLENIFNNCEIKPMANQILCHISNTPKKLIDFCKLNDVLVQAYSPIAHGLVLQNQEIANIAKKYNVSVAKLCIRYTLELGCIPLPKTSNPKHMKENIDIDFKISDEDIKILENITPIKEYGDMKVMPVFSGK